MYHCNKYITMFIYILKLQQNKYYIGKTNEPNFRIDTHFNANGSAWTKKYKPISVSVIIPNCDNYDEDKYTLLYMSKYGIDNVRGGSFVQLKLSEEMQRILNGPNDKRFNMEKLDISKKIAKSKKMILKNT